MFTDLFRSALTLCFCLIFNAAQAQFYVLFDSLTAYHTDWEGDTAWMQFSSEGMRSAAPAAGSLEWRRESRAAVLGVWTLNIQMDFNPSSANYCSFRFMESSFGYYAVQLSGSSSDDLSFVLHTAEKDTILAAVSGYVNNSAVNVALRIERDSNYTFHIYDADSLLFSTTDSTLRSSKSLSVQCTYSSSRVDKFLFSTLRADGHAFRDTVAPKLLNIDVLTPQTLRLHWSEPTLPPPGSLNGVIARSAQGAPLDTALFPYLSEYYWDITFQRPLALGQVWIEIPMATDTAGNLLFFALDSVQLDYPTRQSVQILGIHQIEGNDGDYFIAYSPVAMPAAELVLITESGVKKAYDCPLDSGLHRYGVGLNATFIPGFSMPDQGVLILKNEDILVAVQPYHFPYAPHESFGDFLLVADSITYTNAQWRITSTQTSISGPIPPKNLPKNPPKALFGGENGKNYVQFSHSLYPYLHMLLPHLADQWQPEAPYLLPVKQTTLPPLLGDSSLALLAHTYPDSGKIFINEVHPSPDQLDEFIELVSTSDRPLRLDPLRLIKTTTAGTSAYRFFTTPPSFCALPVPLFPLLAPHQLRAFPSPTALPNDSTSLLLQTTDAQTLDQLNYTQWDAPLEHRSWERISLLSSGRTLSNWVPHHARWCCPTEASPNEKNSCSFPATPPDFNAHLQRTHLSYDLNHYLPSTDLWVSMAAGEILSLRLLDRSGRPLTQWLSYEGISGRNPISIGPYLWNESPLETGIYTLQVRLKKSSLVRIKNLPLSIYNP